MAVTPTPSSLAGEFAGERTSPSRAATGFHGSKTFGQSQIVETEFGSRRGRSRADDARWRGGQEPFAQPLGDDEIGHVVQREGTSSLSSANWRLRDGPALSIRTSIRGSWLAISAATRFISEMRVRSA